MLRTALSHLNAIVKQSRSCLSSTLTSRYVQIELTDQVWQLG